MDKKSHMSKADFFDNLAERGLWEAFPPQDKPKLDRLIDKLEIDPGMTVFEPGCGAGRLTKILAEKVGEAGVVIANDISPRMIERAKKNASYPNIDFRCIAAEKVNIPKSSVDRIVCFQAFPHFQNPDAVIINFRSFLKIKGLLAIVHFADSEKINNLHRSHGAPISDDILLPLNELGSLLESAAFEIIFSQDSNNGYWLIAKAV